MTDIKITRILMDMATVEDGIAKGHEAKANLFRELASEIEFPEKEHSPEKNPEPTPNGPFRIKVVPLADADDDVELDTDEIVKAALKWLTKNRITVPPMWR